MNKNNTRKIKNIKKTQIVKYSHLHKFIDLFETNQQNYIKLNKTRTKFVVENTNVRDECVSKFQNYHSGRLNGVAFLFYTTNELWQ